MSKHVNIEHLKSHVMEYVINVREHVRDHVLVLYIYLFSSILSVLVVSSNYEGAG